MACYSPLLAWQTGNGSIVFVERMGKGDVRRELSLPCGQCIGCRLERSRQWALRCMHEARMHESNSFLTLTYANEHMPHRGCLRYTDFQKFMKRLRKRLDKEVSYYMCGEYGPLNWRPHYHACLFGYDFPDKEFYAQMPGSGANLYRSAELERLWPYGFCSIGDVTFESAAYVARYCVQKITGPNAKYHYARSDADGSYQLPPEFNRMSLKRPIGKSFYEKYSTDMYPHDYVVRDGQKMQPPKYYDKLFKREEPDTHEELVMAREAKARAMWEDNVPARLYAKKVVAETRADFLKRTI